MLDTLKKYAPRILIVLVMLIVGTVMIRTVMDHEVRLLGLERPV